MFIGGREVRGDTVDELLVAVRRLATDENDRGASLNTRAAGLTGIAGIVLSLAAVAGAAGGSLATAEVRNGVRVAMGALVALALLVLVAAVIMVVSKVLLSAQQYTIDISEIRRYPTFAWITRDRVLVQGHLMKAHIQELEVERERNNIRAVWLWRSYALVCCGVALVTVAGVAGTLDRYVF